MQPTLGINVQQSGRTQRIAPTIIVIHFCQQCELHPPEHVAKSQGFSNRASPAAVGLKPSASITKATFVAWESILVCTLTHSRGNR